MCAAAWASWTNLVRRARFPLRVVPERWMPALVIDHGVEDTGRDSCGGSCTSPLRIIPSTQKPGKMPQLNPFWRGHCHGVTLFYYQLALLAIMWLFIMLHLSWPRRRTTPPPAPGTPITPKRKRSSEPKPFVGLTHKPHCAWCEQEVGARAPAPPRRPDPIPPTHRRPRTVDTSMHFCPHSACESRGGLALARGGYVALGLCTLALPLAAAVLVWGYCPWPGTAPE